MASEPTVRTSGRRSPVVMWALTALLVAMGVVVLPAQGVWVAIKTFALEVVGILLALFVFSRGEWTGSRVRAAATAAPNIAVFCFLAWIGLSVALSDLPEFSRNDGMRHLGGGLIYFAIVYGLSVRRHLSGFVAALSAAGGLAALLAFAFLVRSDSRNALAGAFHNEQLLAAVLCVLLPVVLMVAVAEEHPLRRTLAQISAVFMMIGVVAAQNRSVWLGAAVSLILLGGLYYRYGRAGKSPLKKDQIVVYGIVLAIAALFFLGVSGMGGTVSRRANTLSSIQTIESFRWRQGMWDKALRMARARPILGWGVGTFPINQALFFHPACPVREQLDILQHGVTLTENAHNTYLQLAAEIGFPGLILYLGIFATFFFTALRALSRISGRLRRCVLLGCIAGIVGQMVSGIGNPAWEFAQCSLFFWTVLGLGAATAGVGDRGRDLLPSERPNERRND